MCVLKLLMLVGPTLTHARGPTAETWNGRAAMVGLILTFVIEGATHHGIFRG